MTAWAMFSVAPDFGSMVPVREVEADNADLAVAELADWYLSEHRQPMPPCRLMVIEAAAVTSIEWRSADAPPAVGA